MSRESEMSCIYLGSVGTRAASAVDVNLAPPLRLHNTSPHCATLLSADVTSTQTIFQTLFVIGFSITKIFYSSQVVKIREPLVYELNCMFIALLLNLL